MRSFEDSRSNTFRKVAFFSLLLLLIQGCVTFEKASASDLKLNSGNIKKIEGRFEAIPFRVDTTKFSFNQYLLAEDVFDLYFKDPFKERVDTISGVNGDRFIEIKVMDKSKINLIFFKNEQVVFSKIMKYKLQKDGHIYLSKRYDTWGVPFLMGVVHVNHERIGLGDENQLVMDVSNYRGGAILLLLFLDGGKTRFRLNLKRINQ